MNLTLEERPVKKALFFGFAVVLGLILVGTQSNVFACGASNSGSSKMGSTDKVNATMAGSYAGGQCAAKDGVIKSAANTADDANNTVKFATAEFSVKGMTCGGCENQVKTTLMNIEGVGEVAKVCHVSEHATVKYDPAKVNPTDLASAIAKLGYNSEYMVATADEAKDKAMEKVKEIKSTDM